MLSAYRFARSTVIECGDEECSLDYIFLSNCYVYLHSNSSDCDIPCKLNGCQKELHHFILCPQWTCTKLPTSTTTTTTTTTTRTTTSSETTTTNTRPTTSSTTANSPATLLPPLPPLDHPGWLYLSIAVNILFVLILMSVVYYKAKKHILRCWRNRQNRQQNQNETRTTGVSNDNFSFGSLNRYFSLGSNDSENEPLIGTPAATTNTLPAAPITPIVRRSRHSDPLAMSQSTDGFSDIDLNVSAAGSRVASFLNTPVGTPQGPNYLLMKTFKPQQKNNATQTATQMFESSEIGETRV